MWLPAAAAAAGHHTASHSKTASSPFFSRPRPRCPPPRLARCAQDLLDDALATRAELGAGAVLTAALRLPAAGCWAVRYHFLSEGHDIGFRVDLLPDSAELADSVPELAGSAGPWPSSGAAAAELCNASGSPHGRPPPLGPRTGRRQPRADGQEGGAEAEGSGEEDDADLFWTPQQSFDELRPMPDDEAAPAVGQASDPSNGPAVADRSSESAGGATGAELRQLSGPSAAAALALAVPLRALERADAHVHTRRGTVGPFCCAPGDARWLGEAAGGGAASGQVAGAGWLLFTLSNEHSWLRGRAVRYRLTLLPVDQAADTAAAPPPADGHLALSAQPLRPAAPQAGRPSSAAAGAAAAAAARFEGPPGLCGGAADRASSTPSIRPAAARGAGGGRPHSYNLSEAASGDADRGSERDSKGCSGGSSAGGAEGGAGADERDAMPFDEYFKLGTAVAPGVAMAQPAERWHDDGLLRRVPSSASETNLGPIALTMADDFPLSLRQMLPLAQALAVSSRQHESLAAFFEKSLPPGFPVQFTLAVFPTVSATITFGKAAVFPRGPDGQAHPDAPAESVFEIPAHYARGKYRNFGERFLDG